MALRHVAPARVGVSVGVGVQVGEALGRPQLHPVRRRQGEAKENQLRRGKVHRPTPAAAAAAVPVARPVWPGRTATITVRPKTVEKEVEQKQEQEQQVSPSDQLADALSAGLRRRAAADCVAAVERHVAAHGASSLPLSLPYRDVLKLCGQHGDVSLGVRLLSLLPTWPARVALKRVTALISAAAQAGDLAGAQSAFNWIEQQPNLKPDRSAYSSLVAAAARARDVSTAESVFARAQQAGCCDIGCWNALVTAYARVGRTEDVMDTFRRMQAPEMVADVVTYNTVLGALGRAGASEQAKALFAEMLECGMVPTARTYVALYTAAAQAVDVKWALDTWQHHKRSGVQTISHHALTSLLVLCANADSTGELVDGVVQDLRDAGGLRSAGEWSALLTAYQRLPVPQRVVDTYKQMRAEGFAADDYAMTALLTACKATGGVDFALAAFDEGRGRWGVVVCNALLDVCGRHGLLERAFRVYRGMRVRDVLTYNTLIHACASARQRERAFGVYKDMLASGFTPTPFTYGALLDACAKDRAGEIACTVFDEMQNANIKPDVVTYTTLISACAQSDSADMRARALSVFHAMRASGVRPAERTYAALLSANPTREAAADSATVVLREAEENGGEMRTTVACVERVVHACARVGDTDNALALVKQLASRHAGLAPATLWQVTQSLLREGGAAYVERALRLLALQRSLRVVPTPATVARVVAAAARAGMLTQAQVLWEELQRRGSYPNRESASELIAAYTRAGQPEAALRLYRSLDDNVDTLSTSCVSSPSLRWRGRPRVHAFALSALAIALARAERVDAAMRVYADLKEAVLACEGGNECALAADADVYQALIEVCCRAGRVKRALAVFADMQQAGVPANKATLAFLATTCAADGEMDAGFYAVCAQMRLELERPKAVAVQQASRTAALYKQAHVLADDDEEAAGDHSEVAEFWSAGDDDTTAEGW